MNCKCGTFNKVSHIGFSNVIRRLELGIKTWLEYNLLNIGGWTDVSYTWPEPLPCLSSVNCPGETNGTCFQTMRHPWVWDFGAQYTDISGGIHTPSAPDIYINGSLVPSGNYSVNYETGIVCFNSAPPINAKVTASYGFRNVPVYIANEVSWWTELQFRTTIPDDSQFKQCTETGEWTIGSHHRIQLPTILLYVAPAGSQEPMGLGKKKVKRVQDVVFHIVSEDKCMRDNLVDLLIEQAEACILLFNPDEVEMPLDCNGARINNNNYETLINNWPWACTRVNSARISDINSYRCGLHDGWVVFNTETVFCDL